MKIALPTALLLITAAGAGSWIFPLLIALMCGTFCYLAVLREQDRLPAGLARIDFLMDILDRLTDRQQLKSLLAKTQPKSVIREFDRAELTKILRAGIIGHDAVINDVVQQVWAAFKMSERDMPVGVFMFAGPPSTGKTEFGRVLGKALYGDQPALLLKMASFADSSSISTLLGASPAWSGRIFLPV